MASKAEDVRNALEELEYLGWAQALLGERCGCAAQ
jgi:hypothetical protein